MPYRRGQPIEEESSGYEESAEESAGDEDTAVDFTGGLRTTLVWDAAKRQLNVKLRQQMANPRRLEFKYKGLLNTNSGEASYNARVRKSLYTDSPVSMQRVVEAGLALRNGARPSDPDIDPNRLLPAGFKTMLVNDWIISPGLAFSSQDQRKVAYSLMLRKAPQFLRHSPKFDCWLSGKAETQVDPKTSEMRHSAAVRLKMVRYSLTDKQDLRLCIGLDLDGGKGQGWSKSPYLKVGENNFGVKLQRSQLSLLYEI